MKNLELWAAFGLLKYIGELVNSQKADHEIVAEIKALIRGTEANELEKSVMCGRDAGQRLTAMPPGSKSNRRIPEVMKMKPI